MSQDDRKKTPGPQPDHLKLDEDDWTEAVKKALGKKKPPEGWPDHAQDEDQPMDVEELANRLVKAWQSKDTKARQEAEQEISRLSTDDAQRLRVFASKRHDDHKKEPGGGRATVWEWVFNTVDRTKRQRLD